jgi:arylsulfatase A-like enzyme
VALEPFWDSSVDLILRTRHDGERSAMAMWGTPRIAFPRRRKDPPSVLLIAIDTLRVDRLGSYGYRKTISPNIDGLAADGVLFENAISQSNWTLPAFASIFTGQTPHRHRMLRPFDHMPLEAVTLAERFREGGWLTEAIMIKPTLARGRNLEQGFERYFKLPLARQHADMTLAKVEDWLEGNHDLRFFLFLHFNDPHEPFNHPEEFVRPRTRDELERFGLSLPIRSAGGLVSCEACPEDPSLRSRMEGLARALYEEEITYLDDRIGRLIDGLKRLGIYEETLIVLVSDHGEVLWESWGPFNQYGHGGRGHQDHLIRVPFIVKPPSDFGHTPGSRVRTQIATMDLMPTLLELAGIPAPTVASESRSIVPLLSGAQRPLEERGVFSLSHAGEAVRLGRWKYMREILPKGGGSELLFDLKADPRETHDASAKEPETFETLRMMAMEHALQTSDAGVFVFATAPTDRDAYEVQVRLAPQASLNSFPHYGVALGSGDGSQFRFRGRARGRVVLLAGFRAPRGSHIEANLLRGKEVLASVAGGGEELPDYRDGFLQSLMEGPSWGSTPSVCRRRQGPRSRCGNPRTSTPSRWKR